MNPVFSSHRILAAALALLALSACAKRVETFRDGSTEVGFASWYGGKFHGRKTASGEVYDMNEHTAAHRRAPFGTEVRVVNLSNGRSTRVRINDRGPFVKGRIIDLSLAAAKDIGLTADGTAKVELSFAGVTKGNGRYFVQAGAFRERENADRRLAEIQARLPGWSVAIRSADDVYRIWVGPFSEEQEAVSAVETARREGFEALILRR
jgi:rare lipoprotein A